MAQAARVTSVEALVDFKTRLVKFGTEAANALANIQVQIRRTHEWLEDQLEYWKWQLRERQELVVRAKGELLQRQYSSGSVRGAGCTDQKIALEEALDRVHEAETKIQNCKHWRQLLPRELMECEGPARQLAGLLESDFRRAVALLEQKIQALDEYLALIAPVGAGTPASPAAPAGPAVPAPEAGGTAKTGTAADSIAKS
jgi:hypothetical protein